MNYYERHLGDYAKDASHLSMLEHGAYTLLMDRYYSTEQGIPADQVYKVTKCRTKAERRAVDNVLEEFFLLQTNSSGEIFINQRCEEEIKKYQSTIPESEAKKENQKERQKRSRERRKALFDALRDHDIIPKWDTSTAELSTMLSRVTGVTSHRDVTLPVTRDDTATQSPVSIHHRDNIETEITKVSQDPAGVTGVTSHRDVKRHVQIAILLRNLGMIKVTAANPHVVEWGEDDRVTDEILRQAVDRASLYKPIGSISAAYLKPIIEEILNPKPVHQGRKSLEQQQAESTEAAMRILDGRGA